MELRVCWSYRKSFTYIGERIERKQHLIYVELKTCCGSVYPIKVIRWPLNIVRRKYLKYDFVLVARHHKLLRGYTYYEWVSSTQLVQLSSFLERISKVYKISVMDLIANEVEEGCLQVPDIPNPINFYWIGHFRKLA